MVDKNNTAGFGKGAVIALYTGAAESQRQCLTYSADGGKTFTKYAGNPVLTADILDFRDPKMFWNESIKVWNLILAAGQEMRIYSFPNLIDWKEESRLGLGYGKDHYATVSFSGTPDGLKTVQAWMSNWEYANQVPTRQFRSANSIARDLFFYEIDGETYLGGTLFPIAMGMVSDVIASQAGDGICMHTGRPDARILTHISFYIPSSLSYTKEDKALLIFMWPSPSAPLSACGPHICQNVLHP